MEIMNKKLILFIFILFININILLCNNPSETNYTNSNIHNKKQKLIVSVYEIDFDKDNDGIKDLEDILDGARKDAKNEPKYISKYYSGGYPPSNEGVCTDVIWRAFLNAGYNLKDMIDEDIKKNIADYPRVNGKPEPNIDFRRVLNLIPFFKKYATVLTTKLIPKNITNLKEWQAGDIVVFSNPISHIAIISDKRNDDGIPFIIHNASPYTIEEDGLLYWSKYVSKISYHFRYPKIKAIEKKSIIKNKNNPFNY